MTDKTRFEEEPAPIRSETEPGAAPAETADGAEGPDANGYAEAAPEAASGPDSQDEDADADADGEGDEWDRAEAQAAADVEDEPPTKQSDILIGYVNGGDLFRDQDNTAFVDIVVEGHRETWPVRSTTFRQWLLRRYYDEEGSTPAAMSLTGAIGTIEARAVFAGLVREVHVRAAAAGDDRVFVDMGDPEWRAIEITAAGWQIVPAPQEVRFRRSLNTKSLPMPKPGGSLSQLRGIFNFPDDADFRLAVACLLAALRGKGPYPPVVLDGEQGSAKSSCSTAMKSLVDPAIAPLRGPPGSVRDLAISAASTHVLAFDNLSAISDELSDAICRLATGGAFTTRKLYSDDQEAVFDFVRPCILAGIGKIVTRGDLGDRSIFLTLERIADDERMSEADFADKLERERPQALGFLLDTAAAGLRHLPAVKAETKALPRMASFALWIAACERGLEGHDLGGLFGETWKRGSVLDDYAENRRLAKQGLLEGDSVGRAVQLMPTNAHPGRRRSSLCVGWTSGPGIGELTWSGTATRLLRELERLAAGREIYSRQWPRTPGLLSGELSRSAPLLREQGVTVQRGSKGKGRDQRRTIVIVFTAEAIKLAETAADATDKPF